MPKGSRVLMADDDKMLIDMYSERLELAGYIVDVCRNGEEALAKIRESRPDIVLLDIMMPKINGYEALASIKSDPVTKDIPVIMLSALMRDFNREKAVEAGADDYLIKSEAMPADVINKVEQVLNKYVTPVSGQNTATAPTSAVVNAIPSASPPVATNPVSTPVATPEASVMQPDAAKKPTESIPAQPVFEPSKPAIEDIKSELPKEEEVPVVTLNNKPIPEPAKNLPTPTMAWEPEPDQELGKKKEKTPANVALIVVAAILLTALVNDVIIYFFFFANK